MKDDESEEPSSAALTTAFWRWRGEYPGQPFWVHLQTMDLHWPERPHPPFTGLYVEPSNAAQFSDWETRLAAASGLPGPTFPFGINYPPEAFEKTGIDPTLFFETARGMYDEAMAQPHSRVMDFTGRPSKGMVYVGTPGFQSDSDLKSWVDRGVANAESLPAK